MWAMALVASTYALRQDNMKGNLIGMCDMTMWSGQDKWASVWQCCKAVGNAS